MPEGIDSVTGTANRAVPGRIDGDGPLNAILLLGSKMGLMHKKYFYFSHISFINFSDRMNGMLHAS